MQYPEKHSPEFPSGDALLAVLSALANPHRMRIIAFLAEGRNYVSQLARDLGISRPLLHMHLRRLESAGLVRGSLALSEAEGRAMRYFELVPFALHLTPERIAEAAQTLSEASGSNTGPGAENKLEEE
jgi:DNA-binding transcriptional ArsR family regulator